MTVEQYETARLLVQQIEHTEKTRDAMITALARATPGVVAGEGTSFSYIGGRVATWDAGVFRDCRVLIQAAAQQEIDELKEKLGEL